MGLPHTRRSISVALKRWMAGPPQSIMKPFAKASNCRAVSSDHVCPWTTVLVVHVDWRTVCVSEREKLVCVIA